MISAVVRSNWSYLLRFFFINGGRRGEALLYPPCLDDSHTADVTKSTGIVKLLIGERAKQARHSQVCSIENRGYIYIMVRAISVSAGVPYTARFTAAVKIPLPLATFQF